jgi:uncharacterized RDD family membrane protein YckC
MKSADDYISAVIACLPPAGPTRAQIEMDLRAIIGERLESGRPLDQIFSHLGDPKALALSYLGAAPLVMAPLGHRVGAKLTDLATVLAIALISLWVGRGLSSENAALLFVAALVGGGIAFGVGTIGMEYRLGQTPGKRMFGLHVVQESGASISLGQSVVRQLPMILQIYWIDALFGIFTAQQQRAFEVLSKTRVVLADPPREARPDQ